MRVTIDTCGIDEARAEAAVAELRKLKAWYEQTAEKRVKAGTHTLEQVSKLMEPVGDALTLCGMVSVEMAQEDEPKEGGLYGAEPQPEFVTPGWPVTGSVCKDVSAEMAAEDRDVKTPACRFCGEPGKRHGARKDGFGRIAERYYVCETAGCLANKVKTPQPARIFAGA